MKKYISPINLLYFVMVSLTVNSYVLVDLSPYTLIAIVPIFIFVNLFAGTLSSETKKLRLRVCHHGGVLLGAFAMSLLVSVVYHAILAFITVPDDYWLLIWSLLWCVLTSAVIFWNGMLCVYCTSVQMGIKWRLIGALCGMIPILNLIALDKIIGLVMDEVELELDMEAIASVDGAEKMCETKYPILFVHGVFFRDSKNFNYWGRIPRALTARGATVYYGEHQSALSVADSGRELASRIKYIIDRYGCEKVNIIAHSKGGLDCRYAISECGIAQYVASLTTVNTPHRGCLFADRLLSLAPDKLKRYVSTAYNVTLKELGDENPDFIAAVTDLTAEKCEKRDTGLHFPAEIYSQSVGSILNKAHSGQFPLNLSYRYVRKYDGPNDGLVGEASFKWGERYTLLTTEGRRGISHGDMIDLNRENIKNFNVRLFYVGLVNDLKNRGL